LSTSCRILLVGVFLLSVGGCHSAFVYATIANHGPAVRTVEVDYPSQSFGTEQLVKDQTVHFRFKVQGSGPVKLQFMDATGKTHTSTGPSLTESSEGTLAIDIDSSGDVAWAPQLHPSH
jgi:hypothetical protein